MSLFSWFFGAAAQTKGQADADSDSTPRVRDNRRRAQSQPRFTHDTVNRSDERKTKRHARREQLYQAVRESMTLSGVLSASYQFKVLSLDQVGKQFLVMMDVERALASQVDKLGDIEARIAQTAKTRFRIEVTAVYWRIGALDGTRTTAASPDQSEAGDADRQAKPAGGKKPASRYEPIQADEVAAFKQALAAAAAIGAVKPRRGPQSYTLLTGFEDTEMARSSTSPALSTTQYGDLN